MLLPPPTPFFLPPYPLPPLPLSGCVRRGGLSGGTAAPAIIRDGPDGRTTKTRYITPSAAVSAAAEAETTEEEACDGCVGANPRRCLDNSSLLRSARTGSSSARLLCDRAAARRRQSLATATTSMPAIDIGALFIGREDWEENEGSGIATEDDDDTDAEAGGYERDFLEVVLCQLWEGCFGRRRTTTTTTKTSRDDEHEECLRGSARANHHRCCPLLARSANRRQRPR